MIDTPLPTEQEVIEAANTTDDGIKVIYGGHVYWVRYDAGVFWVEFPEENVEDCEDTFETAIAKIPEGYFL